MILLNCKNRSLIIFLCLLLADVLSLNAGCKGFVFGGAIDTFPTPSSIATIDNQMPGNLIVYLDGEPIGIAFSFDKPFDVLVNSIGSHPLEDHAIEVKNSQFLTVYSVFQSKDTPSKAATINPTVAISTSIYAHQYIDGINIHNPNGGRAIIFVNGNPFGIIYGHSGSFVKFIITAVDNSGNNYLIEARTPQGELQFSQTFDYSQINKEQALLLALEPYSLLMSNLTDQKLGIFINGELIGDINSHSDVDFTEIKVSPTIYWQNIVVEYYLLEARDSNGTILYSQNFEWLVIDGKKDVISIPFSEGPKIIISNATSDDLTIFYYDKQVGMVSSNSVGYVSEPGLLADVPVTIKNAKGKIIYSDRVFSLGPDIKLRIPPADKSP